MKKLVLLTLLSIAAVAGAGAQDFSTLINEAENLYYQGNYAVAAEQYEQALMTGRASEVHYYGAACAWAKTGNREKAMANLQQAIDLGWMAVDPLLRDPDLESLRETDEWESLIHDLRNRVAAFESGFNKELLEQLAVIEERDQQYRKEIRRLETSGAPDGDRMVELENLQASLDAQNLAEIEPIIAEYGYPGKQLVGDKCEVAFMVIQHSDLETQKEYLPILEMAADNGDIPWFSLMRMMDRIDVQEGRLQLYGTTVQRRDWGNQIDVLPLEEEGKNRALAGLPPVERNTRWDVELQKPRIVSQR